MQTQGEDQRGSVNDSSRTRHIGRCLEVMDTTLRDGEQSRDVSFSPPEKLQIVQFLLRRVRVDRAEVVSARSARSEYEAFKAVMQWAGRARMADRIEALGFVDGGQSVEWIRSAGGRVINLLVKGSLRHCRRQLRKTPFRHFTDIEETVKFAVQQGLSVNVYLEDWSQGMRNSMAYVRDFVGRLSELPIKRLMLPDTLGVLDPDLTFSYIRLIKSWWRRGRIDYHAHNDYGLAVANSLAAVKAGVDGVHATVNGLGERAGNAPLDEVVVGIRDHCAVRTRVAERELRNISRLVEVFSGRILHENKPISGGNVFWNTAGIHADGDLKGDLYVHPRLKPQRFGARLGHSMGKLSGKANVIQNLKEFDIQLSPLEVKLILGKVVKMGERGHRVTSADLPYIVADVLGRPEMIKFDICRLESHSRLNDRAEVSAEIAYEGRRYRIKAEGTGAFDAFLKGLRDWAKETGGVEIPSVADYRNVIPPGGKSSALVKAVVRWHHPGAPDFITEGLNEDQVIAGMEAIKKAVNFINAPLNSSHH